MSSKDTVENPAGTKPPALTPLGPALNPLVVDAEVPEFLLGLTQDEENNNNNIDVLVEPLVDPENNKEKRSGPGRPPGAKNKKNQERPPPKNAQEVKFKEEKEKYNGLFKSELIGGNRKKLPAPPPENEIKRKINIIINNQKGNDKFFDEIYTREQLERLPESKVHEIAEHVSNIYSKITNGLIMVEQLVFMLLECANYIPEVPHMIRKMDIEIPSFFDSVFEFMEEIQLGGPNVNSVGLLKANTEYREQLQVVLKKYVPANMLLNPSDEIALLLTTVATLSFGAMLNKTDKRTSKMILVQSGYNPDNALFAPINTKSMWENNTEEVE